VTDIPLPRPGPAAAVGPVGPVGITAYTASCAAGIGNPALAAAVREGRSGLQADDDPRLPCWLGRLDRLAAEPVEPAWDSRATRLAAGALAQDGFAAAVAAAVRRHGATRVGLVLGSSASTIAVSEQAYRGLAADGGFPPALRHPLLNTPHAVAHFVQRRLGLAGPAATVSTACSSSAKALASAARWLHAGLADAVVVAGVEALSDSLRFGFRALGLVDPGPCRPFDAARRGISIGEAAVFVLVQRDPEAPLRLLGWGEANDAHHMSAPHPAGLGAEAALDAALARAGLAAGDIDFLNLHGTGTPANDEVEAALVARRYAATVHACATKGLTGHTMGAAGLLEAVLCALALQGQGRAGSAPDTTRGSVADPALGERFAAQLRATPAAGAARLAASHSFGFGGSNAVLLLGGPA
jgi:3-oxoacyl-[acyl-carrier-protein] synthase I